MPTHSHRRWLFLAGLACCAALPVRATDSAAFEAAVQHAERSLGAYAPDLIELLQDNARLHSEAGRHSEAISQYQRALHLSRVNGGLYNPDQIILLQHLASSQQSLGLLLPADNTRDYLYRVQRQIAAGDPVSSAQAALAQAQWKRSLYRARVGPEPYLWLLQSYRAHSEALSALGEAPPDYELSLAQLYGRMETEYLISHYKEVAQRGLSFSSPGFAGRVSLDADEFRLLKKHNYRNGRKTLKQAIALLDQRQPLPVGELVRAYIALGDWHLWWFQHSSAQRSYLRAYRLWEQVEGEGSAAGVLFPEPRLLPDGEQLGSPGADGEAGARVRFRVSREGDARDIEVLELDAPTGRASDIARVVLFNLLREYRFRPVVRGGEVVTADPVERSFRFNY